MITNLCAIKDMADIMACVLRHLFTLLKVCGDYRFKGIY